MDQTEAADVLVVSVAVQSECVAVQVAAADQVANVDQAVAAAVQTEAAAVQVVVVADQPAELVSAAG